AASGDMVRYVAGHSVVTFDRKSSRVEVHPVTPKYARPLALSPDGAVLAVGVRDGERWKLCLVLEAEGGAVQEADERLPEPVAAAFSADGGRLAVVGHHQVTIWDVGKRSVLRTIELGDMTATAAAFAPDGRMLAVAGAGPGGGQVQLWDVADGAHPPG